MELDKVKELLAGLMSRDISQIDENTDFRTLGMDSLDLLHLIVEAEAYFNITIPEPTLPTLRTVGDLVGILRGKD